MSLSWIGYMFRAGRTRGGVPILIHWSVPALAVVIVARGYREMALFAAGVVAYVAMLFLHEYGHQLAAQRLGYRVFGISIYPLHGKCFHEQPHSQWDHALIAWGGCAAQFIVAVPLLLLMTFADTSFLGLFNIAIVVFAVFSPIIAALNLLPIRPLDGKIAWTLVPLAWARLRRKKSQLDMTAMEAMQQALRKAKRNR